MADVNASDFTGLAEDYSLYRPGYSETVLSGLVGLLKKPLEEVDFADVGAGTGIWTRMVASRGVASATAIEPNDDMRSHGERDSNETNISWRKGSGESTHLDDASCDLVSMASSFHWVDFDRGVLEFQRILRPGGIFVALWNPRLIEVNPLLVEIEAELSRLKGDKITRVSSGRSGITDTLTDRLWAASGFDDVVYLEGRHTAVLTTEHYLGVWRSVNDLQAQLGAKKFMEFLSFVEAKVAGHTHIEAVYMTRAWAARRSS